MSTMTKAIPASGRSGLRPRGGLSELALVIGGMVSGHAAAQTYTVNGISPVTAFGNVAAAETGDTVFFQNNTTVTVVSGSGARINGTVRRATVTIRCAGSGSPNSCSVAGNRARVVVGSLGGTGRARAISEFIATGGTGTITGTTTGPALDFTMTGWTGTGNRTFFLDTKLPIKGDDEGGATGPQTSSYYVYTAKDPTVPSTGMTIAATIGIRRALRSEILSNLNFGTVVRQASGASGTVIINNTTGNRTTGGTNPPIPVIGPAFGRTEVKITGEPSTNFTISYVPTGNLVMSNGTNNLSVTLSKTNTGSTAMPAGGELRLGIGGTITLSPSTAIGQYSGTLVVNFTYN